MDYKSVRTDKHHGLFFRGVASGRPAVTFLTLELVTPQGRRIGTRENVRKHSELVLALKVVTQ